MPGMKGHHAHGTTPIQMLRDEHEVILRVLAALEAHLDRVSGGAPLEVDTLGETVEFLRDFADRRHHAKEEDLLFPALDRAGLPREGGPVGMMMEEHIQGREYIRSFAEGIASVGADPAGARNQILENGWAYLRLLRAHIYKENEILYPLAERVLDADTMHGLTHRFEDAEAALAPAARDRHLALAARLESKGD